VRSWVRVLKLVKHLDAARHGLDQQQRARLKQTFKMIASGATLSVSQQVALLAFPPTSPAATITIACLPSFHLACLNHSLPPFTCLPP
tara:strand:+ start:354 stop:617 length:264 start_codon:yes stop_codon:yes gene_type:complete